MSEHKLTDEEFLDIYNPCSLCGQNVSTQDKWSMQVGGGGEGEHLFAFAAAGDIFVFHDKCYE